MEDKIKNTDKSWHEAYKKAVAEGKISIKTAFEMTEEDGSNQTFKKKGDLE